MVTCSHYGYKVSLATVKLSTKSLSNHFKADKKYLFLSWDAMYITVFFKSFLNISSYQLWHCMHLAVSLKGTEFQRGPGCQDTAMCSFIHTIYNIHVQLSSLLHSLCMYSTILPRHIVLNNRFKLSIFLITADLFIIFFLLSTECFKVVFCSKTDISKNPHTSILCKQ